MTQPFAAGRNLGVDRWFQLDMDQSSGVLAAVAAYADDPNVEAATPDWGGTYKHDLPNTVGTPRFVANAPSSVTVSSNLGGSATSSVTIK